MGGTLDQELDKYEREQDAATKRYDEIVRDYRDDLLRKWQYTDEGKAAIADMIANNAEFVAVLIGCREHAWRSNQLQFAIDRMAKNAVDDLIENASIARIIDICDNTPTDYPMGVIERAELEIHCVST